MNQENIIAMAREAGALAQQSKNCDVEYVMSGQSLERFAELVAAAAKAEEREACIEIIETYRIPVGNSAAGEMACEWTYDALKEIRDDIRSRKEIK